MIRFPLSAFLLSTGAFLFATQLTAQNLLVPADSVVQLREVWRKGGKNLTAERYGRNVWGGVDLNGDSIGDFGVYRQSTNQWLFYAGGNPPDTGAMWTLDSLSRFAPAVGDFLEIGSTQGVFLTGYVRDVDGQRRGFDVTLLYPLTDTGLSGEPVRSFDHGELDPPLERTIRTIQSLNINGDNYDDLVIAISTLRRGHSPEPGEHKFQLWFYLGGPDFTLSRPDVIVYDTTRGSSYDTFNWDVRFADFDGDGYLDMLCGGDYPDHGEMLRFYFGDANSPQSWTERDFDRDIILKHGIHGINSIATLHIFDGDGDGADDLGSREYDDVYGSRLYLSGSGKNVRTRSFTLENADRTYDNVELVPFPLGPLNDSSGRFDMLLFDVPDGGVAYLVSGGSWGPDYDYEADYSWPFNSPISLNSKSVRDVTGDGWDDFIGTNGTYGTFVAEGLVTIFAGGPYIPFDDPTVSVREEPVVGLSGGLFLWPNPVDDELHIAWRGDLRQMPELFEVYDMHGELVVRGYVSAARGEAVWYCADVPPGHYTVVGYDRDGDRMTSAFVIIQR